LIAVSLPSKDSWAYEELYDTVFEADQNAIIEKTRYRGVFLIYLSVKIEKVANNFLQYQHAFLSRVLPIKYCGNELNVIIKSLNELPKGYIKLMMHLREPIKNKINEDEIINIIKEEGYNITKKSNYVLAVESIDDLIISGNGIIRKCGPSCIIIY
jgi:hypothetical protein